MQVECEEEKIRILALFEYLNDFTFFTIVDPKIGVQLMKNVNHHTLEKRQAAIIGVPHLRETWL